MSRFVHPNHLARLSIARSSRPLRKERVKDSCTWPCTHMAHSCLRAVHSASLVIEELPSLHCVPCGDAMKILPCNIFSLFHDLACGQRVKSREASNACSTNCCHGEDAYGTMAPVFAQSTREFVCPACVYVEVTAGLGVNDEHATDAELALQMHELTRGGLLRVAAVISETVTHMLEQGYRSADHVPKINELAAYVREHPSSLAVTNGQVQAVQDQMSALTVETQDEKVDALVDVFAGIGLNEEGQHTTNNLETRSMIARPQALSVTTSCVTGSSMGDGLTSLFMTCW